MDILIPAQRKYQSRCVAMIISELEPRYSSTFTDLIPETAFDIRIIARLPVKPPR